MRPKTGQNMNCIDKMLSIQNCTVKLCSINAMIFFFFTWWRVPQQMLRTHHSLKAFCATLWRRWRWAVFYQVLQVMEHQWNGIDRGKPTTRRKTYPRANLSTTNPPHGLTPDRTQASAVEGRRLTAWAMARPLLIKVYLGFSCIAPKFMYHPKV
jgi:hypothetical protein